MSYAQRECARSASYPFPSLSHAGTLSISDRHTRDHLLVQLVRALIAELLELLLQPLLACRPRLLYALVEPCRRLRAQSVELLLHFLVVLLPGGRSGCQLGFEQKFRAGK